MAYSVLSDLEKQIPESYLIELTDDSEAGEIDESVIKRSIADADAEIDLYCRKKYDVPFTEINEVIRKISVDIAIYNLYARRRSIPEVGTSRYEAVIEILKAIRDGELQLNIAEIGPESAAIDVKSEFTKGKVDYDGDLLGDVMGQWDDEAGSLDDW